MLDGNYEVEVKLPFFGWKKVHMALVSTSGHSFEATISLDGKSQTLVGQADGDAFSASGDVSLPMGINRFDISGAVLGDLLSGSVRTNIGSFELRGKRL